MKSAVNRFLFLRKTCLADLARRWNDAGLLSDTGLKIVLAEEVAQQTTFPVTL